MSVTVWGGEVSTNKEGEERLSTLRAKKASVMSIMSIMSSAWNNKHQARGERSPTSRHEEGTQKARAP